MQSRAVEIERIPDRQHESGDAPGNADFLELHGSRMFDLSEYHGYACGVPVITQPLVE